MINLNNLPIVTDENLVDENGNPRKDAEIFQDKIVCHPDLKKQVQEAFKIFFNKDNFKNEDTAA